MQTLETVLDIAPPLPRTKQAPPSYSTAWIVVLVLADLTMFLLSSLLATEIGFTYWYHGRSLERVLVGDAVFIVLWLIIFERLGLYQRSCALSVKDELYYTITALALGVLPQLTLFTIVPPISTSRLVLLLSLAFSIVSVGATRAALHGLRSANMLRRRRRVAIIGRRDRAVRAAARLGLGANAESLIIEVADVDRSVADAHMTKDVDIARLRWFDEARRWGCDTIIMTEIVPSSIMPHLLEAAARERILFAFAPPRLERHAYSLSLQTDGQQVLIVPSQLRACTPRARLMKRLLDVTVAGIATLLTAPIMLAAALAVWLESGSPVIFRQERVGLQGEVFEILKFRSMRVDAERDTGAVWARTGDDRKTRIGAFLRRTSIDELPQLFNVLRGEMSLVGPRPERPIFVEAFCTTLPRYDERHLVRPGITGWAQIHMKRLLDPSDAVEKLSYDLYYVEQWSLFLDVSVLLQTAIEVLFHRAG
ncbi:sugar transferase [bacterium]|nr:MAG: sugar transferase [bacterium]